MEDQDSDFIFFLHIHINSDIKVDIFTFIRRATT